VQNLTQDASLRWGVAFFPPNWIDLDLAAYAETLGCHTLWIGEHLTFHVPTFDALTAMAAVAAGTRRIGIGVAAVLLPLRPAAAIAKAATTLDILSGGRLRLGVGVGGEFPKEFEVAGVPLAERGQRADEAIAILRALWAPGAASFAAMVSCPTCTLQHSMPGHASAWTSTALLLGATLPRWPCRCISLYMLRQMTTKRRASWPGACSRPINSPLHDW
jgi:alkanesulfonate monooxygenase SsuD/methylene tetrahydromethanopterin reductase-like flavin-dependent oxidoreductase (luciferase family)